MSANLDLVKSIYVDWERGDWSSAEWADPEIEFVMRGGLSTESTSGIEGMAAAWTAMLRAWDDLRAVPEEIREIDGDRVLVLLKNEGWGKGSGIDVGEISVKSANLFTIREGKVTRLVLYWDREEALADLGPKDRAETPRT
jgi:ketosteroid isomerase-like protein